MVQHNFDPDTFGIVLIAKIRGSGLVRRIRVVFDTGATYVVIPWEVAEALGYRPSASREWITMTTASGTLSVPLITLDAIEVLGENVENIKAVCHNLPEASRVDGLLGLSYIRHFNIKIDFKNGILTLDKHTIPSTTPA